MKQVDPTRFQVPVGVTTAFYDTRGWRWGGFLFAGLFEFLTDQKVVPKWFVYLASTPLNPSLCLLRYLDSSHFMVLSSLQFSRTFYFIYLLPPFLCFIFKGKIKFVYSSDAPSVIISALTNLFVTFNIFSFYICMFKRWLYQFKRVVRFPFPIPRSDSPWIILVRVNYHGRWNHVYETRNVSWHEIRDRT